MDKPLESMQAYALKECCKGGTCPICNPIDTEDENSCYPEYDKQVKRMIKEGD